MSQPTIEELRAWMTALRERDEQAIAQAQEQE